MNEVFTKKGNRNFSGLRPKETSKARYGIIINYYDWLSKNNHEKQSNIKDLFYAFYDSLYKYKQKNTFGYIQRKEVLINPVGELRAYRYSLNNNGKKRYLELKNKYGF